MALTPELKPPSTPIASDFLAGGGEMGALMRAKDWANTSLGPVENWPQSLKTSVSTCLNSRFAILIWWGRELIKIYNDPYRAVLGNKHPQALGRPGREVWGEIWSIIGPMLEGVMERGEATWSDDLLLLLERHGYAEECYFTFSYSPIRDESGGIGGIFTPVQETTQHVIAGRRTQTLKDLASRAIKAKTAEEACRTSIETLASNPFDLPFASLYIFDHGAKQARLAGTAGIPAGTPLSLEIASLSDPEQPWFSQVIETGTLQLIEDLETLFPTMPGGVWDTPPRSAVVVPLVVPGQAKPDGVLVAALNPRKRLDQDYRSFFHLVAGQIGATVAEARAFEQARRRVEELAALDRAKTAFFSNVSHEFRTPLTLMLGPVEELLRRDGQDPRVLDQLHLIHRNGLRLQKLVNALLDFSRLEAGRLVPRYAPVDLAKLTTELASNFHSAMLQAGLQFIVDAPPTSRTVYLDRDMWEEIVLNLLSNAFKYTFQGSVSVRLRETGDRVELSVQDTGEGIPESELPQLFKRFHRVQGTRARTHEGTGIGLAQVAELARLLGGSVHVESSTKTGSTFSVEVPIGDESLVAARNAPAAHASPAPSRDVFIDEAMAWLPPKSAPSPSVAAKADSPGIPHILLADDNSDMREYIARLLADDYFVTAVANGEEALEAARHSPPDLILTDVMMPQLDGFGLLRELKASPLTSDIPIIVLSARAGEQSQIEGVLAGANDYLVKPFTARELQARVRAQLESARVRKENAEQLQRTERQLRLVMDQAPVSLVHLSLDGRYLLTNRKHAERFGLRPEETEGKSMKDLLGEGAANAIRPHFEAALRGEIVEYEAEIVYPRSGPRWMHITYVPEFDSTGCVQSVVAVIVDFTDRRRAEQDLVQNRDHLKLALKVGRLGTWIWDLQTDRFTWSEETYRVLGVEPGTGEPDYRAWAAAVLAEDLPATEAALQAAVRGDQDYQFEYRTRWPDSSVHWVHTRVQCFYGEGHAPLKMIGIVSEVTDAKRIESARRALLASEQDARKTAELLNRIGLTLASELDPPQLTRKLVEIATELTRADFGAFFQNTHGEGGDTLELYTQSGVSLDSFVDLRMPAGSQLPSAGVVRSDDILKDSRFLETQLPPGTSRRIPVRSYLAVPVVARTGEVLGRLVFGSAEPDVFTPRQEEIAVGIAAQAGVAIDNARLFEQALKAQKDLLHSNAGLLGANKELEQFAYVASHDLQEPLRMVNSYTQLLLRRFAPVLHDPDAADFAGFITTGVKHMQTLIQDLLTYSKVIHAEPQEPKGPVDLNAVFEEVLAVLSENAAEHRATITAGALPTVRGDSGQFEQLFQNLLANALKYSKQDDPPVIQVLAERSGAEWVISVSDNGIGFDMGYAERIFGLFKRLHKGEYPGTGIGLAICKRIVEAGGGRIWATSKPGQGSTFWFTVPAM